MKLLQEKIEDVEYLVEETEGKKSYYIEGIYMQSMVKNGNGRFYPKPIIENQVSTFQNLIKEKRSLGECMHPQTPSINLDRVSHLITSLRMEGNNSIGRAKILNTPMGKLVQNFLSEDIKMGVSTRGLGSLKPSDQGYQIVQEDFKLITVDIVSNPSAPDAFVQSILESKEYIWENGIFKEVDLEASKKEILKAPKSQLNEKIQAIWNKHFGNS